MWFCEDHEYHGWACTTPFHMIICLNKVAAELELDLLPRIPWYGLERRPIRPTSENRVTLRQSCMQNYPSQLLSLQQPQYPDWVEG